MLLTLLTVFPKKPELRVGVSGGAGARGGDCCGEAGDAAGMLAGDAAGFLMSLLGAAEGIEDVLFGCASLMEKPATSETKRSLNKIVLAQVFHVHFRFHTDPEDQVSSQVPVIFSILEADQLEHD